MGATRDSSSGAELASKPLRSLSIFSLISSENEGGGDASVVVGIATVEVTTLSNGGSRLRLGDVGSCEDEISGTAGKVSLL